VSSGLPQKIIDQIKSIELPTEGQHPFQPKLGKNKKGEAIIEKRAIQKGPKAGKRGYVDDQDRIWIKDRAHAGIADHWDVQIDDGDAYFRVGLKGDEIT
jgi:hypothetical protein